VRLVLVANARSDGATDSTAVAAALRIRGAEVTIMEVGEAAEAGGAGALAT
jgi:hypothetical protein